MTGIPAAESLPQIEQNIADTEHQIEDIVRKPDDWISFDPPRTKRMWLILLRSGLKEMQEQRDFLLRQTGKGDN